MDLLQGHRGIVPPRRPLPLGRPVPSRCPCSCDSNTIRVLPIPWRLPCTSASSRYRLKRCKTRRRAVADSHTTDRRCPPRRYDDPIIPYRSGFLSYAIRGVEVSSHRPRRPTPRVIYISRRCDAESTAAVKNVVGRGSGQKLSSPAKLVRCNDIATVKLHADNRVILPTSPHVR